MRAARAELIIQPSHVEARLLLQGLTQAFTSAPATVSAADANWKVASTEVTKNDTILPMFEEGMKYLRVCDPASALDSFDAVLRMASDLPNVHFARAAAWLALGKQVEALKDL